MPDGVTISGNYFMAKIIELQLEDNWMVEPLELWDYSHPKYFNWLGIVTRDENGNYQYNWLKKSNCNDEYFNVAQVKEGDILYAGCKNTYKNHRMVTSYYGVVKKDADIIELISDTTYLKVKKQLESLKEEE